MIEQLLALAYAADLPGVLAAAISALGGLVWHVWMLGEDE